MSGESEDRSDRGPIAHPGRAVVLIVAGLLVGVLLIAKGSGAPSPTASSSTTSSVVPATSTAGPSTTSSGHGSSTTTSPAKDPSQVTVEVANGTKTSGAAGRIGAELADGAAYKNYTAVDATTTQSASAVYYAAGYLGNAEAIASFLSIKSPPQPMPSSPPVSSVQGVEVLVVVGPDLASGTTSSSQAATPRD